jgi:UDP-2-acetamido-3-amino-2,3-dideoxy-glucuronate N-acetyltransferase
LKIWHPEKSTILDCKIGRGTVVHSHVWIGNDVVIGENCKVQAFAFIPAGVNIGNNVFIGPRVTFTNDKYPPSGGMDWSTTLVGDYAVVGAGAVILPGVSVGAHAFVGAGAVVTKDVPIGAVVVGNPAMVIRTRAVA